MLQPFLILFRNIEIDPKEEYHHILLDKHSRHITTFATHEELSRYKIYQHIHCT